MELNEILTTIFKVVIIPLLSVLTGYLIKWINAKAQELKATTDNTYAHKYVDMLQETIIKTVIAVNQTYVDALKDKNAFTIEAQKEAFQRVYDSVMASLTEEALEYLNSIIGDLNEYITNHIEAAVNENKMIKIKPYSPDGGVALL